jgi:hypothetical protein
MAHIEVVHLSGRNVVHVDGRKDPEHLLPVGGQTRGPDPVAGLGHTFNLNGVPLVKISYTHGLPQR